MKFKFKAQTAKGHVKKGTIIAPTKTEAVEQLKNAKLKKISLQEVTKKDILKFEINLRGVSILELAVFTKNLAVMIGAGIPLFESLAISLEQAKGKLKTIITRLLASLEGGKEFSDALAEHPRTFSALYINIVRSGEASGNLEKNLNQLAVQLEKDKALRSKIKGALIYPMTVLSAAVIIGYVLAIYILPQISNLISSLDVELPWTTRAVLWVANFIEAHTISLVVATIALVVGMVWFFRWKKVKPVTHRILLKIPVINRIVKEYNLALFCRTLGTLLKSGVLIDEALEITAQVVNNYKYKKIISESIFDIKQGVMLGDSLEKDRKIFPPIATKMVSVGERSGKLDDTLLYLAKFYEEQVDFAVKSFTTTLEPILLILIGFVVAVIALAIISPIYKITGSIGR